MVAQMIGAVMQPYFFPYLGYFQLIRAADVFVVYDDVQYIKGGWVNRNRVLMQGEARWLTLPLRHASPNRRIDQLEAPMQGRGKLLKTLHQCYARAPEFREVFPLLESIIMCEEINLARFLEQSLFRLCSYLEIHPRWLRSSELRKPFGLKGEERLLAICEAADITHYINLSGGRGLYSSKAFALRGKRLSFIQQGQVTYPQFTACFTPDLSIVDLLMFNGRETCGRILHKYSIHD